MRPRRSITLLAVLLAAGLSCRGGDATPDRRTLIDSRDRYDPRSLDPTRSTDVPTGRAVAYVFDGLVRFTPDARVVPALAERWDVSSDGTVYTFHLRKGVRFHDGTPFMARHVVRSFERVLDPKERGGRGWPLYPIQGAREYSGQGGIRGLSAPNDSTVVIRLTEPLAIFTKLLAMPVAAIVPDSIPANFGERPIGTGPWKLVRWEHDDYLLFARNDEYWGGPAAAESLMARIIVEASTAVAEFDVGNVDILYIPEDQTRQWEETDERSAYLQGAPGLQLWYAAMNVTRGPLRDARVRRAINHAVDVNTILQQLVGGRGTLAAGVIPPSLEGADTARRPYRYDPDEARRLLAAAGHPNGIDIELWSSTTAPFPRVAEAIQGYLSQVGIRAKLVQREAAATREAARNGQADIILKDWWADYPDAENFLYPLLHGANHGVGGNVSFYANPQFDSIVTRARREQDEAARVALYREADAIAFADAPMLFLFFYRELFAIQPWVSGFEVPVIFNGQDFRRVEIGGGE